MGRRLRKSKYLYKNGFQQSGWRQPTPAPKVIYCSPGQTSRSYGLKRFIGEYELLVSKTLGATLRTRGHRQHFVVNFFSVFVHAGFQSEDFSWVNVHVIAHA